MLSAAAVQFMSIKLGRAAQDMVLGQVSGTEHPLPGALRAVVMRNVLLPPVASWC